MTDTSKPVRRQTWSSVRSRPIVVELHSTWAVVRLKGTRTRYTVTYDQMFNAGARNAAEALRRERAERKKEARNKNA